MTIRMPQKLEEELGVTYLDSLDRGKAVRRRCVLGSALILAGALAVAAAVPTSFAVAVTIAAASLCVIWAVMSMSASLNCQFDLLTKIVVYYSEDEPAFADDALEIVRKSNLRGAADRKGEAARPSSADELLLTKDRRVD